MSATAAEVNLEQVLRSLLPDAFKRMSCEQVSDFCELFQQYAGSQDPEVLDTMVEFLVPPTLGKSVVFSADVQPGAAEQVDRFQSRIGAALKKLRLERGMSQEELAQKAGLKQSHVSRLEAGVHTPSDLTIQRLANALGVSPTALDPGH